MDEYEEALRAHELAEAERRKSGAECAPFVVESLYQLPSDATDDEMLDNIETFGRLEGQMALFRAESMAQLWGKARSDSGEAQTLIREVALIRCISSPAAERMLAASLRLSRGFGRTRARILSGELPWEHAEVLLVASGVIDQDRLDEFETKALGLVAGCSLGQVKDRIRRLVDTMHPEGMAARHRAAKDNRHVSLEPGADGMAWVHLYLEAVDAVAITDRLDRYAVAAHGEQGEERTLGQLRADAAVDLLVAQTADATEDELHDGDRKVRRGNTIVPEVHVTVPVLTVLGQSEQPGHLRGYGPIDPETARRLTADAPSLYRVLTNPETGAVLSLGQEHYEVTAALRRYLEVRDERCRFPGCSRAAHLCDIDHVHPWSRGGPTDHDNLQCLCRRHHQDKDRGWTADMRPDGSIVWTSPFGRKRTTRPAVYIGMEPSAQAA